MRISDWSSDVCSSDLTSFVRITATRLLYVGAAAVLALTWSTARAAYPDHPVKLIVPFAAGGFTDIAARIVAQALSDIIGERPEERRVGKDGVRKVRCRWSL